MHCVVSGITVFRCNTTTTHFMLFSNHARDVLARKRQPVPTNVCHVHARHPDLPARVAFEKLARSWEEGSSDNQRNRERRALGANHEVIDDQSQRSNCPVLGLPPDKFWIASHSARNSDLHLKRSSADSPGPAKQQQASCLAFTNSFDTQGPPTACDSPSSVASGRNRENSVPLRVAHLHKN